MNARLPAPFHREDGALGTVKALSRHRQETVPKAPLWKGPTLHREDTVFPVRRLRHCPSRDRGQGAARLLHCLAVPAALLPADVKPLA